MINIRFILLTALAFGLLAGLAIRHIDSGDQLAVATQNPVCVKVKSGFFNTTRTSQGNISFWDRDRTFCKDGSTPICRFIQPGTQYFTTVVSPDNKLHWASTVASKHVKFCQYRRVQAGWPKA